MTQNKTYTVEDIVAIVSDMPAWDQKKIIRRIEAGGVNSVYGRYKYGYDAF